MHTIEDIKVQPAFDMEVLMGLLQEKRMGGQVLEQLVNTFERWTQHLHCKSIKTSEDTYLVVYLDEAVEEEIDTKWAGSPEDSFRLNCLGQALIMNALYQIMPDVEFAGCAPCPTPNDALKAGLAEAGVPYIEGEPTVVRRFSVLTSMPFLGACDRCFLEANCPKANSQNSDAFHSIEIPGHLQ